MKKCKKCKIEKELDNFHKLKVSKDGFAYECKDCYKIRKRRWYKANPGANAKLNKKWRKNNPGAQAKLNKEWRKANPGAQAKLNKEWSQANKQKRRDATNKWNNANRDKLHAIQKKYRDNNPDKFRTKGSKKRANKLNATPKWYDKKVEESIHKFNIMMEKTFKEKFHLDHIIPLNHSKICGLHCEDNWQTLDGKTNQLKSNKWDGTYDNLNW